MFDLSNLKQPWFGPTGSENTRGRGVSKYVNGMSKLSISKGVLNEKKSWEPLLKTIKKGDTQFLDSGNKNVKPILGKSNFVATIFNFFFLLKEGIVNIDNFCS
jgi:hypothetical protein